MKKLKHHFMGLFLITGLALPISAQTKSELKIEQWPEQPIETQWAPIPYSIIKYTFWNAEKFLNETMNLKSEYCQYTSSRTEKTYSHKEIGACVYHHLIDSMYSKNLQPSVYIWAKNNDNKPVTLKMDWRPHKGSLWQIYNNFVELKYESRLELGRRIYSILNIDVEKIRDDIGYTSAESLIGEMTLQFKLDDNMWNNIKTLFPKQMIGFLPEISQINIKMKPDGRSKHYLQNNVSLEVYSPNAANVIYGEIKTNINVLDTKRMFNASGQLIIKDSIQQGILK